MIAVVDTKKNKIYVANKTSAASIIGVDRNTVARWETKRTNDGSLKEVYNHFEVYFNVVDTRKRDYFMPMADGRRGSNAANKAPEAAKE